MDFTGTWKNILPLMCKRCSTSVSWEHWPTPTEGYRKEDLLTFSLTGRIEAVSWVRLQGRINHRDSTFHHITLTMVLPNQPAYLIQPIQLSQLHLPPTALAPDTPDSMRQHWTDRRITLSILIWPRHSMLLRAITLLYEILEIPFNTFYRQSAWYF